MDVTIVARPIEVQPRPGFRIWIRYDDGIEGEVDLSDLADKGVFAAWSNRTFFESVRLGSHGAIEWGDEIDLCPDAVYMRLTGRSPEDVFPSLRNVRVDA